MTTKTERTYLGDIIATEKPNYASRKLVTILAGAGTLKAGLILGSILLGDLSQAYAGTGNGTLTALAAKDKTVPGDYILECVEAASNGGRFKVVAPDGTRLDDAIVGSAYANDHLAFQINDGATDFVVGDTFTVTVAKGSLKFKGGTSGAVDGTQHGAAILLDDVDASGVDDVPNVRVLYREADVGSDAILYDASADNADKKAALRAGLEANHVRFLASA